MDDRRKEVRKNLMAYTQVFDLYGGNLIGYLSDLTRNGCMVIGEKPLQPNARLTLAIELPELPGVSATRVTVNARVAWSQKDISPEYSDIGFEFENATDVQEKLFQAIIDNYEFRRDMPDYPAS